MKTPDEQVSEAITKSLVQAKLLEPEAEKDFVSKLVSGRQTAAEWTLLFKAQIQKNIKKKEKP